MGCLNSLYYEYNPEAVVDNGTCLSKKGDADGDDFVNLSDSLLYLTIGFKKLKQEKMVMSIRIKLLICQIFSMY